MNDINTIIENKFTGIKDQIDIKKYPPIDNREYHGYYEDLNTLLKDLPLFDGMTISFHHHLRNGDYVLNTIMLAISELGYKDITITPSSIFPTHEPMVKLIEDKVITNIYTAYMSGPVAKAVSEGKLAGMCVMHSHGYRATMFESKRKEVDFAFIAAPTSTKEGDITGSQGESSCGVLGYAIADSEYAKNVIAVSDNIVEYEDLNDIEISRDHVNYVLKMDKIGDPSGIVSGTTQITRDPVGLKVAKETAKLMKASGLLKDGFSFQTGAGGISLAVAKELRDIMLEDNLTGSFASGGITDYLVNMLNEGLFEKLYDVQCFELNAVKSVKDNPKHIKISASKYADILNEDNIVDQLDFVILGATEIDLDFNVNVTTSSDGLIMGGSGGHADTAAGAKLSIVVSKLISSRISVVVDKVTTITTPGDTVDILVTDRGIAINPKHKDLIKSLKENSNLKICTIEELYEMAIKFAGKPNKIVNDNEVVAISQYRDGTCIDLIRKID